MKKQSAATKQIEELKAGWQRTQADFDNYKKRTEQERSIWIEEGKLESFKSLLPILDNLTAATNHIPADKTNDSWSQGIVFIAKQIESSLADLGITRISPQVGEKFDHNTQEAVATEKSDRVDAGCIISVDSLGYKIGEKVIRPARVKVKE